MSQICDM